MVIGLGRGGQWDFLNFIFRGSEGLSEAAGLLAGTVMLPRTRAHVLVAVTFLAPRATSESVDAGASPSVTSHRLLELRFAFIDT